MIKPVSPKDLNKQIMKDNEGFLGGTIRDGSADERFIFGGMIFNIPNIREYTGEEPNSEAKVSNAWSEKINVNHADAMKSTSKKPVLIASIPTTDGVIPLLIDGHHRMYKAVSKELDELDAITLTPAETIMFMEAAPDLIAQLTKNISLIVEKAKKKPMNIQSLIFDKKVFTKDKAKAWAGAHGYKMDIDENNSSYRMRQKSPSGLSKMRTINITDGLKAVVGKSQPDSKSVHVNSTEWDAVAKEHGFNTLEELKNSLMDFMEEEKKEPEHDQGTIDTLEQALMDFIEEESVEKDDDENSHDDMGITADTFSDISEMQDVVEGMDYETETTSQDEDQALDTAKENLEKDPNFYKKIIAAHNSSDDQLTKTKDVQGQDTTDQPFANEGFNLHLGSGASREPGFIGIDSFPYDKGTYVHDLERGIPVPDESVRKVRAINCLEEMHDPKALLSEIHRVLMPGGEFHYEGPNEIYNYQEFKDNYPGLILTGHEDSNSDDEIEKSNSGRVVRQVFTRIALPDPATANDAEPRVGSPSVDNLTASELFDMNANGYQFADGTASNRGNRAMGYPSQGALDVHELRQIKEACIEKSDSYLMDSIKKSILNHIERDYIPILKADKYKQIVYGVVLAPNEIDSQEDYMEPEEIEKAAHIYMESQLVGSEHEDGIEAIPVESYIAPQDLDFNGQFGPQTVKKGSWVLCVKIRDPDEWEKVLNGEYTGFSVGGYGVREEQS